MPFNPGAGKIARLDGFLPEGRGSEAGAVRLLREASGFRVGAAKTKQLLLTGEEAATGCDLRAG